MQYPALIITNATEPTHRFENLTAAHTYYWKVIARDGKGGVKDSGILSFTIESNTPNNNPGELTGVLPTDTTTGLTSPVTASWECVDPDGDELTYDIYFGDMQYPSLIKANSSENSIQFDNLESGHTYYWKVIARDSNGGMRESEVFSFTIDAQAPNNNPGDF